MQQDGELEGSTLHAAKAQHADVRVLLVRMAHDPVPPCPPAGRVHQPLDSHAQVSKVGIHVGAEEGVLLGGSRTGFRQYTAARQGTPRQPLRLRWMPHAGRCQRFHISLPDAR